MFRRLFLGAVIAPLLAARCTSSNGVITLDVDKVNTDGGALLTALGTVLASPLVAAALGPNAAIANAALAAAKVALADFDAMTGGKVSLDTTKATSLVNSLIANAQTVLSLIQSILTKLTGTTAAAVTNYVNSVLTLIPFVQLAVSLAAAAPKAARLPMTEAEALAVALH